MEIKKKSTHSRTGNIFKEWVNSRYSRRKALYIVLQYFIRNISSFSTSLSVFCEIENLSKLESISLAQFTDRTVALNRPVKLPGLVQNNPSCSECPALIPFISHLSLLLDTSLNARPNLVGILLDVLYGTSIRVVHSGSGRAPRRPSTPDHQSSSYILCIS